MGERAVAVRTREGRVLSFAVANSYDAPMLKAAKDVARKSAAMTVFDAANDPKKQFSQLQTVVSSKQYDAIVVQPIFGPAADPARQAGDQGGIKVVNVDQILGTNLQHRDTSVAGMSGNVVFIQTHRQEAGRARRAACKANNLNPCNVGYLYSVKVSSLDTAIRNGFNSVIKAVPSIKVVARERPSISTPSRSRQRRRCFRPGRTSTSSSGPIRVPSARSRPPPAELVLVGYGGGRIGLNRIKSGKWYGTVMQRPATAARGMQCAVAAVKSNRKCGGIDVLKGLPTAVSSRRPTPRSSRRSGLDRSTTMHLSGRRGPPRAPERLEALRRRPCAR